MRYKPEHKNQTHQKIVEFASKEFRTQGFDGVGIAKLMGGLDLTHGGFYAHFADKEELIAESTVLALDQSLQMILNALQTDGFGAVIDYYLGAEHRDNPDVGCPLPTLSAEVARLSPVSREAFTKKLRQVFEMLAAQMPGRTAVEKQAKVQVFFATMAGAVSLARAVTDTHLSDSILYSAREHLKGLVREEAD